MAAVENRYFSGQGCVYLSEAGAVDETSGHTEVGNSPTLNIGLATETLEHKESKSGQRLTDKRISTSQTATVTLVMESIIPKNLATALYGVNAVIIAAVAKVQAIAGKTAADIGTTIFLDGLDLTNLTAADSTGAPVPLVLDTDYRIINAAFGAIEILTDWSTFTDPINFTYDMPAVDYTAMFKEQAKEVSMVATLLNTADSDNPVRVELYRVRFNPLEEFAGISDEITQMSLEGAVLLDSSKPATGSLGQFGRVLQLG